MTTALTATPSAVRRLVASATAIVALLAGLLALAVPASAAAMLTASPSTVPAGGTVSASFSGIAAPTTTDWVGVYTSSSAADNGYVAWKYTGGAASGSLTFNVSATAIPSSTYQMRLFANNGWTRLATSNSFTVAAAPKLTASPTSVTAGGTVTGTFSGVASPTTTDWVGVFTSSSAADNGYVAWKYTGGGASGSVGIALPANATPGSAYQLRLFANNGWTRLATSNTFTVASGTRATLSASPSSVAPGGNVTGTFSGISAPTSTDWVGLYSSASAADNGYIGWKYTNGAASGSVAVAVPTSAPAGSTYQLRLFSNNGWTRLATSGSFSVTAAAPAPAGVGTDNYPAGGTGQFTAGECVDFVAWRLRQAGVTRNGVLFANAWGTAPNGMTRFGDAHNWDDYAGSLGYAVNTTPAVGAVAHFNANETVRIDKPDGSWRTISSGSSGHVAYVMKVHADGTVDLEEYNQNGDRKYHQQLGVKAPRYIHIK